MKKLLSIALLTMTIGQPVLCMENKNNNKRNKALISPEQQKILNKQLLNALVKNNPNTLINQVTKLLDQGADVNLKIGKSNNQLKPLHGAIIKNNLALAKLLLNKNADVNAQGNNGFTPLHQSCVNQNIKFVELFLNANADTKATDNWSYTPLYYACMHGYIEIVQLLLNKDTDCLYDKRNRNNETPLDTAWRYKRYSVVLTLLKSLIKPTLDWNQKKVVFIGKLKETPKDCSFATLPIEIIHHIFSFCSNKKENIAQLKKLIDLSNITTDSTTKKSYLALTDILNPKSWADQKTAEETYDKLIELIKQIDEQDKKNKETKE